MAKRGSGEEKQVPPASLRSRVGIDKCGGRFVAK